MKAILALERYPLLMRLHLQANFPARRFDLWDVARLKGEVFRGRWVWESMLITSYMSALPALEVSAGKQSYVHPLL